MAELSRDTFSSCPSPVRSLRIEGRQDGVADGDGRDLVDQTELGDQRRHVRLARAQHQAGSGLAQEVKASGLFVGAFRPEGGDSGVYQPGIDLSEVRIGHALVLHGLGAEVGREDVALRYQAVDDLLALLFAQVQGNALLVPVGPLVEDAVSAFGHREVPEADQHAYGVAGLGQLYLDDFRSQVTQDGQGPGAGVKGAPFQGPDAFERLVAGVVVSQRKSPFRNWRRDVRWMRSSMKMVIWRSRWGQGKGREFQAVCLQADVAVMKRASCRAAFTAIRALFSLSLISSMTSKSREPESERKR